ncbi:MAG: DNA topoisomerase, partial [Methylocella sp.]
MAQTETAGKTKKIKKSVAAPAREAAGSTPAKHDGQKPLIIVESPAKARTLNGFLRGRYHVEASMGHLIDLPERALGVKIDNDFKPEYRPIPGRRDIIAKLREAGKDVPVVLLATDPDREGEAIAWHVANQVLGRPDSRRIEFHEITKSAIEKALENPRSIDENLVEAQQARRILDRLVGYLLSPVLWKKVQRGLSAGRVQSVAVRLVCDREDEIRKFNPEEYWNIQAEFQAADGTKFKAALAMVNSEKLKVTSGTEARRLVADFQKQAYA